MAKYTIERDGQIDFFDNYGIPYKDDDSILADNTDGVYNGNILEFKLSISNLNKVLLQAIKYLSRMRVKGESIPANILLIDLNAEKVYEYKSEDYRDDIQKVYVGASSKDNRGFAGGNPTNVYDYSDMVQSNNLKKVLNGKKSIADMYMPVDIDENCIVGWAERYYRELPKASKGDFLGDDTGKLVKITGEIRDPRHFAGLIRPYKGKSNEKFKYLMDCLNDRLSKKDLGAFYTPIPYAKKSAELVETAVQRALDAGKKDYIILDRCAGTGNLESALIGLYDENGDELISHCVVSTYEYYEYKVLNERIGTLVRDIIPPTEADVVYENGKVSNADAMSEDFINNPIIKTYIDDEDCAIILFENPPYRDDTSGMTGVKASNTERTSFVLNKMKENKIPKTNELANRFIWSAKEFYLRQPTDSYIVFSPIKYWKTDRIINLNLIDGFIFNRKYFHASPSAITCLLWSNELPTTDSYVIKVYDIDNDDVVYVKDVKLEQVTNGINLLFDKRKYPFDKPSTYWSSTNGELVIRKDNNSIDSDGIIGFIVGLSFGLSNPNLNFNLTRFKPTVKNSVCALRQNQYKEYLPILAIKHYLMFEREWYENEYTVCCADDTSMKFLNDKDFIKSCFVFSMLDYYNKCLSTTLPDGSIAKNELCFDNGTIASKDLATMTLDKDEQDLIDLWNTILDEARTTGKCNPDWTYGIYQITKEINTYHAVGTGKSKKNVYDYPALNGNLDTLRAMLKEYYKTHITDKMFMYELLK